MKDDIEKFYKLREGANPVHPDRLADVQRVHARPAAPRFLPAMVTVVLTAMVLAATIALLTRYDRSNINTQLGSGQLANSSTNTIPEDSARISVDCVGDPVRVTVANGSGRAITLRSIESYDEDDTFAPGSGQLAEQVDVVIPSGTEYTYRLPESFLRGDPARRMVGVHLSFTSAGRTCSMGPSSDVVDVPPTDLPDTAQSAGARLQGHKGADPASPWGIPALLLEEFELENAGVNLPNEGSPTTRLLLKHGGKQLLHNEWILKTVQRTDSVRKVRPDGIYFIVDARFRFESPEKASDFLAGSMEALRQEAAGFLSSFSPLKSAPRLGDETVVYKGAVAPAEGNPPVEGNSVVYGYGFRTGSIVSTVVIIGDEGMTEEKALEMTRAAEAQVRKALEQGR